MRPPPRREHRPQCLSIRCLTVVSRDNGLQFDRTNDRGLSPAVRNVLAALLHRLERSMEHREKVFRLNRPSLHEDLAEEQLWRGLSLLLKRTFYLFGGHEPHLHQPHAHRPSKPDRSRLLPRAVQRLSVALMDRHGCSPLGLLPVPHLKLCVFQNRVSHDVHCDITPESTFHEVKRSCSTLQDKVLPCLPPVFHRAGLRTVPSSAANTLDPPASLSMCVTLDRHPNALVLLRTGYAPVSPRRELRPG